MDSPPRTKIASASAVELRDRMAGGALSATDVADSFLERVDAREAQIGAWAHLDRRSVKAQAEALDRAHAAGEACGPLFGLLVGIKDIIDTADMPTENGTPLDAGRRPERDATIVQRLRQAGAVVMGKTVTTELASMHPRGTRSPFDATRTPGGSSSGSAAAVATGMAPLAIGTQTGGSVIRPASFCGVIGFKPTFGLIPRSGVLAQAAPLDTIGVFARTIEDAALLVDAIAGHDAEDPDSLQELPPNLLDAARAEPPATARLAFVRTPAWDIAEEATRKSFAGLVETLGKACEEVALPPLFDEAADAARTIQLVGIARHYRRYQEKGADQLSDSMRSSIRDGLEIAAVDYLTALDLQRSLVAELEPIFKDYDAIVTPAAPGEAPTIDSTGNPVFNASWTLCGVPAITLPLLTGPNGLPVGVQLVGRGGEDARLLQTARWLTGALQGVRGSDAGMAAA